MFSFLKQHPFAVDAFFQSSMVITYAVQKEELAKFIPECLTLDTFEDRWAFIAVAMVQTTALRPAGFPVWMGNDFFLIGYRIFVRYTTSEGKRLRGLYILKSETNKKKMQLLGNIFTNYKYSTTDINISKQGTRIAIQSYHSGLDIQADTGDPNATLPRQSPFPGWKEARRFAGPLPHTFTYNNKTKEVLIIEGLRANWDPKPITLINSRIAFIDQLELNTVVPANAFIIENIPYHWKKGRSDQWKQQQENPSRVL